MTDFVPFWTSTWADLSLPAPTGLRMQLLHAYTDPQRHYHTLQHLRECLQHLQQHCTQAERPGELAVALWFHDAVYDMRSSHNEQRSAEWAVQALHTAGADVPLQTRVHDLIMATRHDRAPQTPDQALMVDIDLAILGASPSRFAEYEQQIHLEYAWAPAPLFTEKRRSILQDFLARPYIYHTAPFRLRYEDSARRNLKAALARLPDHSNSLMH